MYVKYTKGHTFFCPVNIKFLEFLAFVYNIVRNMIIGVVIIRKVVEAKTSNYRFFYPIFKFVTTKIDIPLENFEVVYIDWFNIHCKSIVISRCCQHESRGIPTIVYHNRIF